MYQFLKIYFSFLMCFLVILMGCTNRKISREFSDTMEDGSRVVVKIAYKPKSVMNSKGEKFGSYYFIAKHFFSPQQNAEVKSGPLAKYAKPYSGSWRRVYISFYDREGHLLLKNFFPDGYTQNFSNHEKNTFDSGVEWKGQFDERIITVENFRDIHSITAQSR